MGKPQRAERRASARERGRDFLAPLSRKEPRRAEEIFGVSSWLGDVANATDLRDLFTTFP